VAVPAGASVEIVGIDGLTLRVRPREGEKGGTSC
jgi:hypothetical protein